MQGPMPWYWKYWMKILLHQETAASFCKALQGSQVYTSCQTFLCCEPQCNQVVSFPSKCIYNWFHSFYIIAKERFYWFWFQESVYEYEYIVTIVRDEPGILMCHDPKYIWDVTSWAKVSFCQSIDYSFLSSVFLLLWAMI